VVHFSVTPRKKNGLIGEIIETQQRRLHENTSLETAD
jgi:hypothetical protein